MGLPSRRERLYPRDMDIDKALAAISGENDGMFSRQDCRGLGVSPGVLRRRISSGAWVPVGAAALRFRGSPLTWRGTVRAALWDAGPDALASHGTAARLHRFPGFFDGPVELLVPRALDHVCTIATIHESRRFHRVENTVLTGLPTVAAADTLVHLAPQLSVRKMEWLLDELWAGRRMAVPAVQRAFDRLAPGCRGMKGLRAILRDRSAGAGIAESVLERKFMAMADRYGLPPFEQQAAFPGREHLEERVDFLWRDVRLIVEADGRRWHTRVADFDRDHWRDLRARAKGWSTVRVTWLMLDQTPAEVCAELLAARAEAA
jgi:hypothetical protein